MTIQKEQIEELIKEDMRREGTVYECYTEPDYSLDVVKKSHDKIANTIISYCNKKQFEAILDVGCGYGDLVFSLENHADKVMGIDVQENFIKLCELKKEYYKSDKTEFFECKSELLPFKDGTFDLVMSKTVLEHVENVDEAIKEQARVTRLGGQVYVECPNYMWIKEGH